MSSLTQPATAFRHPAADGYSLGGFAGATPNQTPSARW